MIEVNLLPGGRRKSGKGRGFSLSLPKLGGAPALPKGDPWAMSAGGAVVLALLAIGWLFMGVAGEADELEVRIESAVRDSLRLADVIERAEGLQARRDSIAERVAVIQEIDGSRYVWPHLLDELGRALPEYTWLTRFFQLSPLPNLTFRLEGRSATYFALTTFMENLEASQFVRGVRLIGSEQTTVTMAGGGERIVYDFVIEGEYRDPPPELLEMVPLFGGDNSLPTVAGGGLLAPAGEEN